MNIFADFQIEVEAALGALITEGKLPSGLDLSKVAAEPPRDASHGDVATNAAMVLSKQAGMNPRVLAELLVGKLKLAKDVAEVSIAGPGFINAKLKQDVWPRLIASILQQGAKFGHSNFGKGLKVNVEYVSVNPTGPLHVGHVRGAVFGDALASLLKVTGFDVTKEYYINDAGGQVDTLARSAYLRYLEALGQCLEGNEENPFGAVHHRRRVRAGYSAASGRAASRGATGFVALSFGQVCAA